MLSSICNIEFNPLLIVFFICWFVFCLLLIFKPHAWINTQNRYLKQQGIEIRIFDEKKFIRVYRMAGFWLIVLGICLSVIIYWYIVGLLSI